MTEFSHAELSQRVLKSRKFQDWQGRIETNGNRIKRLDILSVVSRGGSGYYAAFLDALLETPEGTEIPRCIVLRGESVLVIPVFRCREDGLLHTLMVEQRCICDGALHLGFPAGNAELNQDDLRLLACQEVEEELGIALAPEELIPISDTPISINASLTDDLVHFYYFLREVPFCWLREMEGRMTGCHSEGEFIKVKMLTLSEAVKLPTASTLIGLRLLEAALDLRL